MRRLKLFAGIFLGIAMLASLMLAIPAQQPAAPLKFEVASIKPNKSGPGFANIDLPPNGRLNVVNATFRMLMQHAYRLQNYQMIGGPDWLDTDRFDIQAKPSAEYKPKPTAPCFGSDCPMTPNQITMQDLLLQNLLVDRFQLKTHRETRELPIYELTVGKNGFKLKEAPPTSSGASNDPPPPPPPGTPPPTNPASLTTPPPGGVMVFPFGLAASDVPLSVLTATLSGILGRPVIDKTGLKGHYNFKLVYSRVVLPSSGPLPAPSGASPSGLDASDPLPSIFTALSEQFGLKLESTKGPVAVQVIDHVEKPIGK